MFEQSGYEKFEPFSQMGFTYMEPNKFFSTDLERVGLLLSSKDE